MKFGCVSVNYHGFGDHLKKAKVSQFNNNWNNIHDFTPVPGETNYSFLAKVNFFMHQKKFPVFLNLYFKTTLKDQQSNFIPLPSDQSTIASLNLSFSPRESVIPMTTGISMRPNNEPCLIVIFTNDPSELGSSRQEAQATSLINEMRNNHVKNLLDLTSLVITKEFIIYFFKA